MSNPAVYLLHQNKVHGNVLRIEDNLGEAIHIHYGDSRFSITVDEFNEMCVAMEEAARELFELEGLSWNAIDKSSLDWNWLCNYEKIEKISIKQIRLGDLYTKRNIYKGEGFQRTVKLKDSLFVEELNQKNSDIDKYKECNMYGQSSRDRLNNMYKKITETGYPFDGKYIAVSGENIIYDGDHRAACLYVNYGQDYEIPVLELRFKNQTPIQDILNDEEKEYRKFILKTYFKAIKRRVKRIVKPTRSKNVSHALSCNAKENVDIRKVYEWLNSNGRKYYFVSDNTLIIEDMDDFVKEFTNCCKKGYEGYKLLYSIKNPVVLNTSAGEFMVWDRLCCKSRFENSLLPLDKLCNEYAWNTTQKDSSGIERASLKIEILYSITRALLEKMKFSDNEIAIIQNNLKVLDDADFLSMIDKEFFGYSGQLIQMLKSKRFDECINKYITNTSY